MQAAPHQLRNANRSCARRKAAPVRGLDGVVGDSLRKSCGLVGHSGWGKSFSEKQKKRRGISMGVPEGAERTSSVDAEDWSIEFVRR